jgi:hypothetical protein
LAVTQFLLGLRYNDPNLLTILGGKNVMIESPVLQGYLAERSHKGILLLLEKRFGTVPPHLAAKLRAIVDEQRLLDLNVQAGTCPSLEAFQALLDS